MIEERQFKNLSVIVIFIALVILSFIVIMPLLIPVIMALVLSYIFYPLYKFTLRIVREKNISAFIIIILILFVLFIPLWFLLPVLLKQTLNAYTYMQKLDISEFIKQLFPQFSDSEVLKEIADSIDSFISNLSSSIISYLSNTILDIPNILLKTVVLLFVFFFALRDGEELIAYVKSWSPFPETVEKKLSKQFKDITNSIVYGHIIVGALQGALTGIGLFIFGIPHAVLFTLLAIITAILPILGAWLVWIPVVVYLFITGKTTSAVIFLLYCVIVVSWVDNILRPYIVSRKTKISSAVIIVGMMGGL